MLWLLAFSCFFATLNYDFFNSSFWGTPYSPTNTDNDIQYTYFEGEQLSNTEIFVPMERFDGIAARPIVSSDGQSVVYYKFYTSRDSFGLYIKNLLTGEERFLIRDGIFPDWSPDGEWIAFNLGSRIYKIRTSGENLTQLTFPTSYNVGGVTYTGSEFDADWSADGRNIIFSYGIDYRSNVSSGVYKIKSDGLPMSFSERQFLFQAFDPDWSPTMQKIIGVKGYTQSVWKQFPIYDVGTNQIEKVFDAAKDKNNGSPQYSPAGSRIIFWNEQGIWVMNADGTAVKHILPHDLNPDRFPDYKGGIKLLVGRATWYPDGKHLIYTHFKVTRYTITDGTIIGSSVNVEGNMSFYKVNVDSAISISNLP